MPKDAAKLTAARAAELYARHGTLAGAAAEAGCSERTVRKWLHRGSMRAAPTPTVTPATPATPSKGRTLAEFRGCFDKSYIVPTRVKAGLAALGKDGWEYEVDFAKLAAVSLQDLGRFRDQFSDHVVVIGREGRRAWAGSAATAAAMREMLA